LAGSIMFINPRHDSVVWIEFLRPSGQKCRRTRWPESVSVA
jgi:hypothetical protein